MHPLPHSNRSNSGSHPQGEGWDDEPNTNTAYDKEQVRKANSVPITLVLKAYGIKLNHGTKHIHCPFAHKHKQGKDNSPSCNIYVNTNSFWCFGCKTGTTCVDFVCNMEREISLTKSAELILKLYNGDIELLEGYVNVDFDQRLQMLMEFSNYIRELMNNTKHTSFLEEACLALDQLTYKYKEDMNNDTLLSILDRLRKKVDQHIKCQQ